MNLIDYLNKKYPSGNFGLMALEAKVFRIKYPLQSGWLQKHRDDEITMLQIRELKALLQKKDKDINNRTVEFLSGFFTNDDHLELIKNGIRKMFPMVNNSIDHKFKKQIDLKNKMQEKREKTTWQASVNRSLA
jgi:hypothetical protein